MRNYHVKIFKKIFLQCKKLYILYIYNCKNYLKFERKKDSVKYLYFIFLVLIGQFKLDIKLKELNELKILV